MKITVVLSAFVGAVQSQLKETALAPSRTVAQNPAFYTSVAFRTESSSELKPNSTLPTVAPIISAIPPLHDQLELMLSASLDNCLHHQRAEKCDGLDKVVFVERSNKFLNYWKTDDYNHDGNNQTGRDLLIRLVEYQDVYQTLVTENEDQGPRFPDNIVDLVRSARDRATEEGALNSANARVLDALDVIYNDVCADTKKTKVPRRVQEITDIVLRGLVRNYDKTPFDSTPDRCICAGHFPCGLAVEQYWDIDTKDWMYASESPHFLAFQSATFGRDWDAGIGAEQAPILGGHGVHAADVVDEVVGKSLLLILVVGEHGLVYALVLDQAH
ncbi:hypothetical protein PG993_013442 [Apiospora rasikravindrae]|uniref:Uncharacterized protein n=1 Tax=Apiospora rasikravindrae TaxID=990691 RepID=A0ABR1RXN3_9PEZI